MGSQPGGSGSSCEHHIGQSKHPHQVLVNTTSDSPGMHTPGDSRCGYHRSEPLWRRGLLEEFTGVAQVSHQPNDYGSGHCVRRPTPPSPATPPPTQEGICEALSLLQAGSSHALTESLSVCGMAGVGELSRAIRSSREIFSVLSSLHTMHRIQ